jgi:hypothetical protein
MADGVRNVIHVDIPTVGKEARDADRLSTLSLIKARTLCHDDMLGTGGIAPSFLTSTLDRGEWSASHSGRFTAGERTPLPIG